MEIIRRNAELHSSKFTVIHGVLSKKDGVTVPPFCPVKKDWVGVKTTFEGTGRTVPSLKTLPIIPSVVVADCEGCLLQVQLGFCTVYNMVY